MYDDPLSKAFCDIRSKYEALERTNAEKSEAVNRLMAELYEINFALSRNDIEKAKTIAAKYKQ